MSLLRELHLSSAYLVAASLSGRRPVTKLFVVATVDAFIVSEQVLAHWELRQVNLRDNVLALVPIFHALLAVFICYGSHSSRYTSITEWYILLYTVRAYPLTCESEIETYLLTR